ncbi:MAG: Beta-lactamase [candidate division BRC1 bacterium ADurb.BinA364]|nr:MAG: Beta-lactamase [candidate division BRC1 bacterium ADurb.BinA364]
MRPSSFVFIAWALAGYAFSAPAAPDMVFPGEDWERTTPEAQGVDSAKLAEAVANMDANFGSTGASELVIVRNGRLIYQGPKSNEFHPIWSCTKTFTSTVLGLLCDDGLVDLDAPAVEYWPELDDEYPLYGKIRLRHLASMRGGFRGEVIDKDEDRPWGEPMAYLNPQEPYFEAGSTIQYNDHDVFVLGRILTLKAGEPLKAIFERRIADPIGMKQFDWGVSGTVEGIDLNNPPGNPGGQGAGGVKTTAVEYARVGLLYLNKGNWNGKQLISEAFVEEATRNQSALEEKFRNIDLRGRYGFYWWTNGVQSSGVRPWPNAPAGAYTSHGHSSNFCYVIPEWRMVVVRMGQTPVANTKIVEQRWDAFFGLLGEALIK